MKTDKIDARILAHLLRTDLVPEAWAPPAEVRELRDLVRLRWRFVAQRTTAKNRISNLLARQCLRFAGTRPLRPRAAAPGSPNSSSIPTPVPWSSCCSPRSTRPTPTSARSRRCCASASPAPPRWPCSDHPRGRLPHRGDARRRARRLAPLRTRRTRSPPTSASCPACAPRPTSPTTGASPAPARRTRAAPWSRRRTSPCACPGRCATATFARAHRRGKKVALVAAARELLELSWTLLTRGEVYRAAA